MKANEVMKTLRISRSTLMNYKNQGKIRVERLHNGHYDYNDQDVYNLVNNGLQRMTVVYARVSTPKQKKDLESQVDLLKQFCFMNGYTLNRVYSDVASGTSFDKCTSFFEMLDLIIEHKVERVVIAYKDRLSRIGFELFKHLFERFGTEIIVISEVGSEKLDSQEVFEEIVSLLHCYSMKLYSSRKRKTVEELIQGDL